MRNYVILESESGQRLDRYLKKILPNAPLSLICKMGRTKKVRLNGKKAEWNDRIESGDTVSVYLRDEEITEYERNETVKTVTVGTFDTTWILHEDDDILVVNKPPRLTVHPGDHKSSEASLIELVQDYLGDRYDTPSFKPSLVHRLDRDTSGAILIAKNRPVLNALLDTLQSGHFEKTYLAVTSGVPEKKRDTVRAPLLRLENAQNEAKVQVHPDGQKAVTHYETLAEKDGFSLLKIRLETGRTHQIRVHMAHLGCPVTGDRAYGNREKNALAKKTWGISRQLLHASELSFPHPTTKKPVRATAPVPDDMRTVFAV